MKIAYLINQYPSPSHTFIRKEIMGMEHAGMDVLRLTIRRGLSPLVDMEDQREAARTQCILETPFMQIVLTVFRMMLHRPLQFIHMFRVAIRLGVGSSRGVLTHFAYAIEACLTLHLIEQEGAHHIHTHFSNSATVAMLCRELGGPPFSFTAHGPEEFDAPLGLKLREKIAAAKFVVGVCEYGITELRKYSDDPSKVKLVRCGVGQPFLGSLPTPIPLQPRIIFVGRLVERKMPHILAQAVELLALHGVAVHARYIGDGPMRDAIPGKPELIGWADATRVHREIEAARVLVLPSSAEGLPIVLMESLALGRPVIATPVGGISELVHGCGWLVPVGDVAALAAAIREAIEAPIERLADMATLGRQRVLKFHNANTNAASLARLIACSNNAQEADFGNKPARPSTM